MNNIAEAQKFVNELKTTQRYKTQYDYTRSFTAKADTADTAAIPLPTEGAFLATEINIAYTKNSAMTKGTTTTAICVTKLKFRSQADNASQSNDYIPVQLIATPGAPDSPRYGARPFFHIYQSNDSLLIDYDNRAPTAVAGETYSMADEKIDVVIKGWLFVNAK